MKRQHVSCIALLLLLAACSEGSAPGLAASRGESCKAPGTSAHIERALCRGDSSNLRDALFSDPGKTFEAAHKELLRALQRIWYADRGYGQGLPWDALQRPALRAVLAEPLSQGIRNGEIEGSLEDVQKFALEFVHGAKDDAAQLDGLRLLGLADSKAQVPLLKAVAQSSEGPRIRRFYAIEAMGTICAPEAAAALTEIAQSLPSESEEAERIRVALNTRERLSESWCKSAASLPVL